MAAIEVVDLEKLGGVLKDAADALAKFGDAIAHLVGLSSHAWDQISARRARARLTEIYVATRELVERQGVILNQFSDIADHLPTNSRRENFTAKQSDWEQATTALLPVVRVVKEVLEDVRNERSDFVLEEAYDTLRVTLDERMTLFDKLRQSEIPSTAAQQAALKKAVYQWRRLLQALRDSSEALRQYLREAN